MRWIRKTQDWGKQHPWILGAALTVALLIFGCRPMMRLVGNVLVRDDLANAAPAPAMILMGAFSSERADQAISLYRRGVATKLIIATTEITPFVKAKLQPATEDVHYEYLKRQGVPHKDIVFLRDCFASSTLEEAGCLRRYWQEQKLDTPPIVVTSWYHSSRAGWLMEHSFQGDVALAPATEAGMGPNVWWHSEREFLAVFNEYLKWLYWLIYL